MPSSRPRPLRTAAPPESRQRLDRLLAPGAPPVLPAGSWGDATGTDPWSGTVPEGGEAASDADRGVAGDSDPGGDLTTSGRHRGGRSAPPRLLTVPASLRTADLSVRPAAVLGMVLVLLLASGLLAVRVWRSEQAARPEPVPAATSQPDSRPPEFAAAPVEAAGATAAPATTAAPEQPGHASSAAVPLLVHVTGQVAVPGVVELPPGSRVADAVESAGGLTPQADTMRINLARPVADGELVWVPAPDEEQPDLVTAFGPSASGSAAPGYAAASPQAAASADSQAGEAPTTVDLNSADQTALETLPGVGPVTAGRILEWRAAHGPFRSAEELLEVRGIGEKTLEQLRSHVTW